MTPVVIGEGAAVIVLAALWIFSVYKAIRND
ncbi:hypothetical protein EVB39_056 [Rhizobium phage RHph_TM3_3_9]|nr:hypothetical protein EVB39_056 [Rhizobium phage RHph_TM3_3_9]QIG68577.1 hypothetical protein EVB66_056 [Rhizobium phage RHph_TM3_3_13]QIG74435.1 hypothetical protein EVC09_055 [Rhizobium phage RHph_TM3_3_10]QXV74549.1 hypothetical protein [Rhizobium phage RHEph19]